MDYKRVLKKGVTGLIIIIALFCGCSDERREDINNSYYIELVNFNDSLKLYVSKNLFGKVTYFRNNKLEIVSKNYIDEVYPDMHYLKSFQEIGKKIQQKTIKIKVGFIGNYNIDSISYSLQKYQFRNNQWDKISDLGVLKEFTTYKGAKNFSVKDFGNKIIKNIAYYTY